MRVTKIEPFVVSVPYHSREVSSVVQRDGVTDVLIKLTTDSGLVGWGESCSGANVESVLEAVRSAEPAVLGRNPWHREAIAHDFFHSMLWEFRAPTGSFAFAGIDMALWDLCGKAAGQPVCNLLGGIRRSHVNYFCYLPRTGLLEMREEASRCVELGYSVFYLKVGNNIDEELEMVAVLREIIGHRAKIRLDANGAWTVADATRNLHSLAKYDIDFIEQPVPCDPVRNMVDIRRAAPMAVCANEGLWSTAAVWEVIRERAADVLNFSSYWVGTLGHFSRLAWAAHYEGLRVSKHTHGELGVAATAMQQVCLTLPNLVDGNQQVATLVADDVLTEAISIRDAPDWFASTKPGLGITIDESKVETYHRFYREHGQFLPYQPDQLRRIERDADTIAPAPRISGVHPKEEKANE